MENTKLRVAMSRATHVLQANILLFQPPRQRTCANNAERIPLQMKRAALKVHASVKLGTVDNSQTFALHVNPGNTNL